MVRVKIVLSILTVCIALTGYLPLQPYLDPVARVFFPVALLLGLYLQSREKALPPRVLTPLSILLFLYFAVSFSLQNILVVTADLLVVFLGVRMLGERSGRNYLQTFALALFCLAASSLYNLTAIFLLYLLLLLLLVAVSLVVLTFHSEDPETALSRSELKKVLTVALLMPVAALPILLFLFALLPRTQYPLWDIANRSVAQVTGFSETVNPGGAASQTEVKTPVLRAVCRRVPDDLLYWRGVVLNGFRQNAWVRLTEPEEQALGTGPGMRVQQEIYPEPSRAPYLLALNIPVTYSGVRFRSSGDAVFALQRPLERRANYQVQSVLSGVIRVGGDIDREFYLRLPQTVSARVRAEGARLARSGADPAGKVRLLEAFVRGRRIAYATTGMPVGGDPIDDFLFQTRRGNCEFFASASATLLRLAGVPTRLVGGYRGGAYNEMGGYYLVTEDLAHVWVEAFVDGRGWVSFDPSAWSTGGIRREGVAQKMRLYMDTLGFYWNKAVITYDLDKQISLVSAVGSKARNLRLPQDFLKKVAFAGALLLPLGVVAFLYLKRPKSVEERLLKSFFKVVRRRYPQLPTEQAGLFQLAQSIHNAKVREFVDIYGSALYRDRRLNPREVARLKEIIRLLGQHQS